MMESPWDILVGALDGGSVGPYALAARDPKPGRTGRETYFNLFLAREGELSRKPVLQGLFFAGRGDYIKPWLEFRYGPSAGFEGGVVVDLEREGLTSTLLSLLGGLVPPGGSMMVIYGGEAHPLFRETEEGLKRGFPPPATPLGRYLWGIGLRWFKDWYFPEGWLEGSMKLQATRPLDREVRVLREVKAREELSAFAEGLRGRRLTRLEEGALAKAEEILDALATNA